MKEAEEESKIESCAETSKVVQAGLKKQILLLLMFLPMWMILYSQLGWLSKGFTYNLMQLPSETHFASAVEFFVFEVPKVLMLLVLVVFSVGIIRTFFTPERSRQLLSGKRQFAGHIAGASLGIVTPFCSCSAVPLFLGFVESGVPLGITFSFLVAAPMINEIAIVLLFGMFGFKVTAIYVLSGFTVAVISGWLIGRFRLERFVEDWVYSTKLGNASAGFLKPSWEQRISAGFQAVREIVGKVWVYLIVGIAVGAFIHGYVPTGFMALFMGKSAWWAVPGAVILGVPMYSNAAGIVPIVHALLEKGASLGTSLAFMMAVIGLSLPETIILRKVLKLPLLLAFNGIVALGIIFVGYLFNYLF